MTLLFSFAKAIARLTAILVFPTPPFPAVIEITCTGFLGTALGTASDMTGFLDLTSSIIVC